MAKPAGESLIRDILDGIFRETLRVLVTADPLTYAALIASP